MTAQLVTDALVIASNVAAAVVGQLFNGNRQVVDPVKPMVEGSHQQVQHVVAGDAARGGEEAHGFPVTAVEHKGDRTLSPLSQPISKPSEHQRRLRSSTAMRPSWRRSTPPAWRSSSRPWTFITQ